MLPPFIISTESNSFPSTQLSLEIESAPFRTLHLDITFQSSFDTPLNAILVHQKPLKVGYLPSIPPFIQH